MEIIAIPGAGFDSNVYVLKAERPVVVDATTGMEPERLLAQIKKTGLAGRLDRVVLTHRHCDHAGGAAFLAEALGAKVLAPPLEAEALRSADASTGALMFGIPMGPFEVEDLGDELDLGDAKLKVISTPGHTSGGVCLLHEASMALVCGDTIFAGGATGRWDLDSGDFKELLASVEMLSKLGVESLHPGHGPSVDEGAAGHVERSLASLRQYARWERD